MVFLFCLMVLALTIILPVKSQEGNFARFGLSAGDDNFTNSAPAGSTYVEWNLRKDIPVFGGRKIGKILIFEFGVITFGDKMFTSCPPTPRQFDMLGQTIIAVYWIPAQIDDSDRDSEIFFRMNLANKTELNRTEVEGFIEEINITRNESLVFSDVESVIYITWVNLKQLPGTLAEPGNRLSFQTVILSTADTSYEVNIYRTLDYSRVHNTRNPCRQQALVGLRDVNTSYYYRLTNFFPFKSNNILIHTNIEQFVTLGRYVFVINNTTQTNPHLINCNDNTTRDPFCIDGVSPRFCEGKEYGNYEHPSFCNRVIRCSPSGQDVETCTVGLGFNSFFSNCDWPGFLRCVDIRRDIPIDIIFRAIEALSQESSPWAGGSEAPPLPSLLPMSIETEVTLEAVIQAVPITPSHMNTVPPMRITNLVDILQFAVHNNTCIGLQNASNVIDPTSCNHFFRCTNTRSVRERCPSNLFYDPKNDSCEFPHKVNCIQNGSIAIRFNSTENVTVATPSPIDICSSAKFGLTADPNSCEHYFQCAHGQPFRRKCPSTLYFNSKTLVCEYQDNVQCQNSLSTPSTLLLSTQPNLVIANISSICQNVTGNPISSIGIGNNGLILEPGSCVFILRCSNGLVTERLICPGGSFFDKQKQTCVIGAPYTC